MGYFKKIKSNYAALAVAVLALICLITRGALLPVTLYGSQLYLWYRYFDNCLPAELSKLASFSISLILNAVLIQLAIFIPSFIGFRITYVWILAILLFAGIVLYRYASAKKKQVVRKKASYIDLGAILISAVFMALNVWVIIGTQGGIRMGLIKNASIGLDDGSHFAMFKDVGNNGVSYANANLLGKDPGISNPGNTGYPEGWQVFTSTVTTSITKAVGGFSNALDEYNSNYVQLMMYLAIKPVMLFMMVYYLSLSCGYLLLRKVGKANEGFGKAIIGSAVVGVAILTQILPVYKDGFFSFYPIIVYTCLAVYLLLCNDIDKRSKLLLYALLTAGSFLAWPIVGIVNGIVFVSMLLAPCTEVLRGVNIRSYRKTVTQLFSKIIYEIKTNLPAILIVGIGSMQIITQLMSGTSSGSAGSILVTGGIVRVDLWWLAALSVPSLFLVKRPQEFDMYKLTYFICIALLWVYFIAKVGETRYYYDKLIYPLSLVLLLESMIFIGEKIKRLSVKDSLILLVPLFLFFTNFLYGGVVTNQSTSVLVGFPESSLDTEVLPMIESYKEQTDRPVTYVFYNETERGWSVIYSNWGRVGQKFDECNSKSFDLMNIGPIEGAGDGINRVLKNCPDRSYVVVESSSLFSPINSPNVIKKLQN